MGRVITLPGISQYSTTSWRQVAYNNLTTTQKSDYDYLVINGIYLFGHNNNGAITVHLYYGAVNGDTCYFALYGTSDRLVGYCRKGNGHFVSTQIDDNTTYTNYDYVELSETPYNRVFESNIHYVSMVSSEYIYATAEEALAALVDPVFYYPITYSSSNSIVSGPSEAAVGDTVTVSAVPDVGYGITDASTQILVTNNDVAVPYTWDAANNRITFTMPDPS